MSDSRTPLVIVTRDDLAPPTNLDDISLLADVTMTTAETLSDHLPGAEVLLNWDFFSGTLRDAWQRADALRWVHVCAAGVDAVLFDELRESDVQVTNAHGVFDRPIAEFVLASVLAHRKQLYVSDELQRTGVWRHRETELVAGSRALVIGTGGIGRAVARLLTAVGVEVTGAGRTARTGDPDFGEVFATEELADRVGAFDTVVAIAPLTAQTAGLIDATVLAAMKQTAQLVNVGRGALVDERALVDALTVGSIASAALDVFEVEPLSVDSPLWAMPNVHISPHMSGDVIGWRTRLAEQFLDNLRRYRAGRPLAAPVDKSKGYVSG
ncbi:D-2-hydroxyacid dehydrogenase [Williamsia sterculiae]|uniref:Phosphoglycerate dehydrogenase n=1 Tax=Williamsia sterculiae TaxID=1344003 RepID=A0A1N7CP28_9NOCA|nr:D-2-hydroxyacid dehydrogenase [Williamsia sterculiae]SIR65237.1 Phosphoglycerate dehydrogenase [Williamsia sterculiae]